MTEGLKLGADWTPHDVSKTQAPKHLIGSRLSQGVQLDVSGHTGHSACKSALLPWLGKVRLPADISYFVVFGRISQVPYWWIIKEIPLP